MLSQAESLECARDFTTRCDRLLIREHLNKESTSRGGVSYDQSSANIFWNNPPDNLRAIDVGLGQQIQTREYHTKYPRAHTFVPRLFLDFALFSAEIFSFRDLILFAFITGNSSLEPVIEGLCAQIHVNLRWRVFGRNRTGDLTRTMFP